MFSSIFTHNNRHARRWNLASKWILIKPMLYNRRIEHHSLREYKRDKHVLIHCSSFKMNASNIYHEANLKASYQNMGIDAFICLKQLVAHKIQSQPKWMKSFLNREVGLILLMVRGIYLKPLSPKYIWLASPSTPFLYVQFQRVKECPVQVQLLSVLIRSRKFQTVVIRVDHCIPLKDTDQW